MLQNKREARIGEILHGRVFISSAQSIKYYEEKNKTINIPQYGPNKLVQQSFYCVGF